MVAVGPPGFCYPPSAFYRFPFTHSHTVYREPPLASCWGHAFLSLSSSPAVWVFPLALVLFPYPLLAAGSPRHAPFPVPSGRLAVGWFALSPFVRSRHDICTPFLSLDRFPLCACVLSFSSASCSLSAPSCVYIFFAHAFSASFWRLLLYVLRLVWFSRWFAEGSEPRRWRCTLLRLFFHAARLVFPHPPSPLPHRYLGCLL